MTIFAKIIAREIPAKILYEDELCLAFRDISPKAPTHVLVIPKKPIASLADLTDEDQAIVGRCVVVHEDEPAVVRQRQREGAADTFARAGD